MLWRGFSRHALTVRQIEDTTIALHDTRLAARVPRHPCMRDRMDVAPAHAIPDTEPRRQREVLLRLEGAEEQLACDHRRHHGCRLHRRRIGVPPLHLGAGYDPALDEPCHERRVPAFVIAHAQILCGRNAFDIRPQAAQLHGLDQREHPYFPCLMETRRMFVVSDLTQPVHTAHIVDAVHAPPPTRGAATLATPIIASRVTNRARSASLMDSVPGGRSGSTR